MKSPRFMQKRIFLGIIAGFLLLLALSKTVQNQGNGKGVGRAPCVYNLEALQECKWHWAFFCGLPATNVLTLPQLEQIISERTQSFQLMSNGLPVCPLGGKYSLNAIWDEPTCSIGGYEHRIRYKLSKGIISQR